MKFGTKSIAVVAISLGVVAGMTACSSSSTSTPENLPTPSGGQTFSLGDNSVNTGGQLPSYWPADVPTPKGLNYVGGAQLQTSISGSFNGTTPITEVDTQLTTDFKAQGWTSSASFGGGANGGVASWKKGGQTAQVVVANEKGTTVNITVVTS